MIIKNVKALCNSKKITFAELERQLNFASGSIRKWDKQSPSSDRVKKVAEFFNVSIDYLLDHTTIPSGEEADDLTTSFNSATKNLSEKKKEFLLQDVEYYISYRAYQLLELDNPFENDFSQKENEWKEINSLQKQHFFQRY